MVEELSRRTEIEIRMRAEAERKRAEDRERERMQQAERAKMAAERARAEAEAERQRLEAEAQARAMEKDQLRRLQSTVLASFQGTVAVQPAPFNTMTSYSRVQQLARIQLDVNLALSGSQPIHVRRRTIFCCCHTVQNPLQSFAFPVSAAGELRDNRCSERGQQRAGGPGMYPSHVAGCRGSEAGGASLLRGCELCGS